MRDMLASAVAVFRADLTRHFHSGRTYVVLGSMALAACASVFLFGGLVDSDFASLDLLFTLLPAVALLVVPALGARAFAVDDGDREVELLLSLPLTDREIAFGKWLAGCVVLLAGLALTAPVAVTVAYLGSPDWGTAASGLLGCVLLLAAYYAVALAASAIAGQQTTAYLLAVAILLALSGVGSDAIASVVTLPAWTSDALRRLNPRLNLDVLASGRIEAAALFAYFALTSAALISTELAMRWRRAGVVPAAMRAGLLAAMLTGAGVTAGLGGLVLTPLGSIDATSERLYTFSPATIEIVRTVPSGTEIELYWTPDEPTVPAHIRDHARRVRQTLELLVRRSQGRLQLRQLAAAPDSEAEWQALASGLRRIALSSGGSFVLGAVLKQGSRRHVIEYFDVERAGLVEYELASALSRIGREQPPKVGILSPLLAPSEMTEPSSRFAFLQVLRKANDVAVIPYFAEDLPGDLDTLVVIGESALKPSMLRAIDQHVMRGMGLVALLDPLIRLDRTGRAISRNPTGALTSISDLVARYGMAFDENVVGDADNAAVVSDATGNAVAYPFFTTAAQDQIDSTHPASARIRRLLLLEPGSLVLDGNARPLVSTSSNAGSAPASSLSSSLTENAAILTVDGKRRVLAAVAGGVRTSAFHDRPEAVNGRDMPPGAKGATVVAVADIDWILDGAALAAGDKSAATGGNDNLLLFSNLVESAGGDSRLASIRSRTPQSRRFTRVADLLRAAQARHQAEDIASRLAIEKVESTVAEILKATKVRSIGDLPADVRSRIAALYSEIIPARKRQREIRLAIREEIEQLSFRLTALSLVFGPLAALLLWVLANATRLRRNKIAAPLEAPAPQSRL